MDLPQVRLLTAKSWWVGSAAARQARTIGHAMTQPAFATVAHRRFEPRWPEAVPLTARLQDQAYQGELTLIGEESQLPYERPPLSKALLLGTR